MATRGAGDQVPPERGESSHGPSHDALNPPSERAHAVRFASNVDEIGPSAADRSRTDSSATPEQLQALTDCLHGTHLQEQRAQIYNFQPMSLPPSRVRFSSDTNQYSHKNFALSQ
ncbi:hypothetical protein GGR55DRAFT_364901 [Xylaria sp. FL0064]|nr:hypothetical protein GGR55DRAFT_364901 [Xylaria sp. FL0064]